MTKKELIKLNSKHANKILNTPGIALDRYHRDLFNELDGKFRQILNETWPQPFLDDLINLVEWIIEAVDNDDCEIFKLYRRLTYGSNHRRVSDAQNEAMEYIMWLISDENSKAWKHYLHDKNGLNDFY